MHPLLRSPHWREVKIETIACPYGSTRSVAYVRLPGNSVAVAIDCDAACLSPECPLAGPEEGDGGDGDPSGCHASSSVSPVRSGDGDASVATGAACACREVCVRGDPTGWLVDPAFSTIYDPERHGVAFRIDWPRLVALLLGERAEGRLLTLCMGRAGLTVVVREHATMQKEVCVRLAPAWTVSLSLALCPRVRERFSGVAFFQAEFVMNEVRGAGQWHLSVPLATVLGTWEVLRLATHGREWTRAVAVAPPMSHGLVHMWLRSADGRFRCLLSGDGEVRAGQRARTAGSVKTATSPGR